MKVVIAGGNGWLGTALSKSLASEGHEVVILSRSAGTSEHGRRVVWDARTLGPWTEEIEGAAAVVNLTGASIAGGRWTPRRKGELILSRTQPATVLAKAILAARSKPAVLVQQSAVGYYGNRGDETLTEESGPGNDFLSGVGHRLGVGRPGGRQRGGPPGGHPHRLRRRSGWGRIAPPGAPS